MCEEGEKKPEGNKEICLFNKKPPDPAAIPQPRTQLLHNPPARAPAPAPPRLPTALRMRTSVVLCCCIFALLCLPSMLCLSVRGSSRYKTAPVSPRVYFFLCFGFCLLVCFQGPLTSCRVDQMDATCTGRSRFALTLKLQLAEFTIYYLKFPCSL